MSTSSEEQVPLRPLREVMRSMVGAFYIPAFLSALSQHAVTIMLPLYALQFDNGPALAALMLGARGAGIMLSDLPAGMLVTRFGDMWIMCVGLGMMVVVTAAAAFCDSPLGLLLVSFASGVGTGLWTMARLVYVTDKVAIEQRGRIIALMAGVQRGSALIGPALAGISVHTLDYAATFLIFAGIYALSLLALVIAAKGEKGVGAEHRVPVGQVIRQHARVFATGGSVMILLQILRGARLWIIPVWGATLGLDEATIGFVFSASSAIDLIMFYPAGLMLDHLGRRIALTPALLVLGASAAMMPFTQTLLSFALVAMLSGLGNGFSTGIFMTLGGDFAPRHGRGEFLGVWRLVGDIGAATGPFLIGALAQFSTVATASVATGGLGVLGACVLWAFVPETLQRRPVSNDDNE